LNASHPARSRRVSESLVNINIETFRQWYIGASTYLPWPNLVLPSHSLCSPSASRSLTDLQYECLLMVLVPQCEDMHLVPCVFFLSVKRSVRYKMNRGPRTVHERCSPTLQNRSRRLLYPRTRTHLNRLVDGPKSTDSNFSGETKHCPSRKLHCVTWYAFLYRQVAVTECPCALFKLYEYFFKVILIILGYGLGPFFSWTLMRVL
jgi:hypothetical protein